MGLLCTIINEGFEAYDFNQKEPERLLRQLGQGKFVL